MYTTCSLYYVQVHVVSSGACTSIISTCSSTVIELALEFLFRFFLLKYRFSFTQILQFEVFDETVLN